MQSDVTPLSKLDEALAEAQRSVSPLLIIQPPIPDPTGHPANWDALVFTREPSLDTTPASVAVAEVKKRIPCVDLAELRARIEADR